MYTMRFVNKSYLQAMLALKAQCNVNTIGKIPVDLVTAGAVDPVSITHMVRGGVDESIIGQKKRNDKPFLECYHFAYDGPTLSTSARGNRWIVAGGAFIPPALYRPS